VPLRVSSYVEGGHAVLRVAGQLDLQSVPALRTALLDLVDGSHPQVIVDLAEMTFIDSTGLGVLAAATRRASGNGARLCISGAQSRVAALIRRTGLERYLPLFPDVDTAIRGESAAETS
jgi:anti-sigma B factor antagonist